MPGELVPDFELATDVVECQIVVENEPSSAEVSIFSDELPDSPYDSGAGIL
jgi:hypothetical protein